jgi:hypothetical protein
MTTLTILSYLSGVGLVAPGLEPATILGTSLALQICHAIMCRLFAHNNGYPKGLWTTLGLVGGIWAVALLILLPNRRPVAPHDERLP